MYDKNIRRLSLRCKHATLNVHTKSPNINIHPKSSIINASHRHQRTPNQPRQANQSFSGLGKNQHETIKLLGLLGVPVADYDFTEDLAAIEKMLAA